MGKRITDKTVRKHLNRVTQLLLDDFESRGIIKKVPTSVNADAEFIYCFQTTGKISIKDDSVKIADIEILKFEELYFVLLGIASKERLLNNDFPKIIARFIELGLFDDLGRSQLNLVKELAEYFELPSPEVEIEKIASFLGKNLQKISFGTIINNLVENYTFYLFKNKLGNTHFVEWSEDKSCDIRLINRKTGIVSLVEIKIRKKIVSSFKDLASPAVETLKGNDLQNGPIQSYHIMVFLSESTEMYKAKERFIATLHSSFPEFSNRVLLEVFDLKVWESLDYYIDRIVDSLPEENIEVTFDKPTTIELGVKRTISADFLKSQKGSIGAWVKVPSITSLQQRIENNIYILGHDSNAGHKAKVNDSKEYLNVLGLCFTQYKPNLSDIRLRLWLTNEIGGHLEIKCPPLGNLKEEWMHVLVRWNHSIPTLEILINGITVATETRYRDYWPTQFSEIFLGNWSNLHNLHWLNMPLYRVISTSRFLGAPWIINELKNNIPEENNDFKITAELKFNLDNFFLFSNSYLSEYAQERESLEVLFDKLKTNGFHFGHLLRAYNDSYKIVRKVYEEWADNTNKKLSATAMLKLMLYLSFPGSKLHLGLVNELLLSANKWKNRM
jgi:hypothetical protein